MVINHTNNNAELINTITHECYHFIQHISKANSITDEETLASLTGRFNIKEFIERVSVLDIVLI